MADEEDLPLDEDEQIRKDNPRSSQPWLKNIEQAEAYFDDYYRTCDDIDKLYADMSNMAQTGVDRRFQLFWANLEVLKPSIYSRPPVPVVTQRHRKREDLPRKAAEILEKAMITDFEMDKVHKKMKLVRDDVAVCARGAGWCRLGRRMDGKRLAMFEWVDRLDFLHEPARAWDEVGWVARRSWLTKDEARARFKGIKASKWKDLSFEERGPKPGEDDKGEYMGDPKAGVWEIWDKVSQKVLWVADGIDEVLDEKDPYLKLDGFFPCPEPAYATRERRSLMPVPDVVFYKDQLEEINELTSRIAALTEGLRLKGYYYGGAEDVAEAVERLMKSEENNAVLVPVSGGAAGVGAGLKDAIVWLPLGEVVQAITSCIELRTRLIEDVYQITGLSDIMRGESAPSETLGAQQLKAQYGSVRVRQKQEELVRFALDVTRIKAEIMAEHFEADELLPMAGVDDIPTSRKVQEQAQQQIMQLQQQAKAQLAQIKQDPQAMQMAQQDPQKAQQMLQQAAMQLQQAKAQIMQTAQNTVTVEAIMAFLREDGVRRFALDIETDSTIQPDEQAEKQRRTEFLTAIGGFLQTAGPMVAAEPDMAPFFAEALTFAASGFRAGRGIEESIDELAEKMKKYKETKAQAGPPPEVAAKQEELKLKQAQMQADQQARQQEAELKKAQAEADAQLRVKKDEADARARGIELDLRREELALKKQEMEFQHQCKEQEIATAAADKEYERGVGEEERAFTRSGAEQASKTLETTLQEVLKRLDDIEEGIDELAAEDEAEKAMEGPEA